VSGQACHGETTIVPEPAWQLCRHAGSLAVGKKPTILVQTVA